MKTYLHSLTTTGQYKASDHFSLGITYMLQSFSSDDFALDGFNPLSVLTSPFSEVILMSSAARVTNLIQRSFLAHIGLENRKVLYYLLTSVTAPSKPITGQ